jgi:hypothetical protein
MIVSKSFFKIVSFRIICLATPGLVDSLRWVKLTVIPNEECQMIYGQQILENMVCVDGNYNEGTCKVLH